MAIFNNQDPQRENNVGQFGATDESIGAYKQAAEYAKDAEYWAKISESGIKTIEDLLVVVEELLKTSAMQAQDIEDLKAAFAAQDDRLMQLISQTNAAVADANAAIEIMDQKIIEVQKQLDILAAMYLTVNTLPPGSPATGSYNPATGEMILNIPEGEPGKDGSVKDLDTAPQGVPEAADWGFYVDKDDNTVHKALMSDIAKTFPSVTSVKVGTGAKEIGDVEVTATKLGLGNVQNVASYSKTESDVKSKNFIKPYLTKADADTDAPNRQVGEKVLVWNGTSYDFYDIVAGTTGQPNKLSAAPSKQEKRIVTVNLKEPDSAGNIDITVPTGNPSLYLGEMVMFPYDPAKNVSYPGVLPADGRVVAKTAAGDLGPSLISGQLPVVSETEWQAGAKQYFSWGKLADGITDADATNYISIRLPDWTGGEAIRAPNSQTDSGYSGAPLSQIPYVVSVNGITPEDLTGNISITAASINAAGAGVNADITQLTGLTTPLSIGQGGTGGSTASSARVGLELDRIEQVTEQTQIRPKTGSSKRFFCHDNGDWGYYDDSTNSTLALGLTRGGTGGTSALSARANLGVDSVSKQSNSTWLYSANKSKRIFVDDSGSWGAYDESAGKVRALGITEGGTGAVSAPEAWTALGGGAVGKLSTVDLNGAYTSGTLPLTKGGTGATTAASARTALSATTCIALTQTENWWAGFRSRTDMGRAAWSDNSPIGPWDAPAAYTNAVYFPTNADNMGLAIAASWGSNYDYWMNSRRSDRVNEQQWKGWTKLWHSNNTSVDGNGFLKSASPVIKVKGDGSFETNIQAERVLAERIDVGVYRISEVRGFNSDPSWGGVRGGVSVPMDINNQPLIWVDYEVEEDGDIILKTFHRTHPDAPAFAQNNIDGVSNGDPIDIPEGRWVDLRVETAEV